MCTVDGTEYIQGQGKTKKEAKTAAAKNAFTAILGLDEVDEEAGKFNLLSIIQCIHLCFLCLLLITYSHLMLLSVT